MNKFELAQILGFISGLLFMYSGTKAAKRDSLKIQCADCSFAVLSNLLLGGVAGAIVGSTSLVRNVLAIYDKLTRAITIFLIVVAIILNVVFTDSTTPINWLPIFASVTYATGIGFSKTKDIRLHIILNVIIWSIYNLNVNNYSMALFNICTLVTTLFSVVISKTKK